MSDPGFELADAIREADDVELVDFTRDGYRTIFVDALTPGAKETVRELAGEYSYDAESLGIVEDTTASRLRLLSPQKVRMGGNRLLKPPSSDRTRISDADPKKTASRQGILRPIIGPSDEPVEPRYECPICGARYYGRGAAEVCPEVCRLEVLDGDE